MRSSRAALATGGILALLGAVAPVACSALTDLSGLTGGTVVSDASTQETGPGDAASETAPPSEAGSDAGPTTMCPPYVLPATCDPKYASDAKNCCVPGRDCQGGLCVTGRCQPVVIVPDATTDARVITVAGDSLLWATGCSGVVRKVFKDGAGNVGLPKGPHCTPTVAASGAQFYFIEYDGPFLNAAPIDGTQPARVVAEVPQAGARADFARLAVDATRAYWAMSSPAGVWFAPLSGMHVTPAALASDHRDAGTIENATTPYGVAVDATHVYWSDKGTNLIKRRLLTTLGTDLPGELVVNEGGPGDLALDDQRVYFVTSDGFVRARSKDGTGTGATLASGQTGAESIVVDDQYVYWTNYVSNGSVSRVPKAGGAVEVLASNQKAPYSITQDCGTIYFTNQNDFATGEVVKITK